MLGIATVVDRLLQQGISQWLIHHYEPNFSRYSYGFRPQRNAHQAVLLAPSYLNAAKTHVIELDLDKFFDSVNHDKLLGLLSQRVKDVQILRFIPQYLRGGIMEGGILSQRLEGTPQGSPLSPILSNVILDELDKNFYKTKGEWLIRVSSESLKCIEQKCKSIAIRNGGGNLAQKLRRKQRCILR